jgi:hypothetical protein
MIAGATSRIVLLGGNTRGWRNRLACAGAPIVADDLRLRIVRSDR